MRGVRGRALSPWAHNAGTTYKARGLPGKMFGGNTSAGPPSQGAVSGTGQALQGDTIPQGAGGGGGGWAGSLLMLTKSTAILKECESHQVTRCHVFLNFKNIINK
jgi:hypothetical protein